MAPGADGTRVRAWSPAAGFRYFDPEDMSANVNLIAILKAKPFDGLAVHEDAIHTA